MMMSNMYADDLVINNGRVIMDSLASALTDTDHYSW